ncbi:MAG: hypothetical protein HY907_13795 [Deltaproteobacteria bacterium]|nr:hypothetical protein [Deltaproteobacteria bacterium]
MASDDATAVDGEADFAPSTVCPELLDAEGPVRLVVRWRHMEPWAWASPGSAGFEVIDGVLMAAQPSSPWVAGSEPFNVWVDAETGEALPYERDRAVAGASVVAVRSDGGEFEVIGFLPGFGDVPADPQGSSWDPTGRMSGAWGWGVEATGLGIVSAERLRWATSRSAGTRGFGVIEGLALDGTWGVDGGSVGYRGAVVALYRGPDLPGEAFVAWSRTAAGERWLWTVADQLILTDESFAELRRIPLEWDAAFVPAAVVHPDAVGSDFLIAGRSLSFSAGIGMRVERRNPEDLSVLSAHHLESYEGLVEQPEPRDLAGDVAGNLALAWGAQRRASDSSRALCLYLTPLDEDGAPAGPAVRIDEGPVDVDGTPVENVRLIARDGSFFVLWQRQPDMWLARVDHAE